jgi:hypothetical protein
MDDFNVELANLVRKQNAEMLKWHIIGVGNIATIYHARPDLTALNATNAERIWLSNIGKRAEHIRQTMNQYKKEINDLIMQAGEGDDTSRGMIFIRKLDDIINRVNLLANMGLAIKVA